MTFEFTIEKDDHPQLRFEDYPGDSLLILRLDSLLDMERKIDLGLEMSFLQFVRPQPGKGWLMNPVLNVIRSVVFALGLDEKKVIPDLIKEVHRFYLTQGPGKTTYTILRNDSN